MKPYYEHGGITIYHGDCLRWLYDLDRYSSDLVIADPPYNVGLEYGGYNDSLPSEVYAEWCRSWFSACRHLCCRTIVFPGHGNLPMWLRDNKPSAIGCWHKPGNSGSSLIGFEEWEPWLYWTGDKGLLGGSSVITARTGPSRASGFHPCPKPLDLLKKLIKKTKTQSVCDPFMGSGTTLIAAKQLGIKAVGIEVDEMYCELAAKRLSQEVFSFDSEVSA